jgi:phosphatidylglycerophosphate synthase
MIWKCAIIIPAPQFGWRWAEDFLMGLPGLIRVLLVLKRAGIGEVILPAGNENLEALIEIWRDKRVLPTVRWLERNAFAEAPTPSPLLVVRGGILFEPLVVRLFADLAAESVTGEARATLTASETKSVLWSLSKIDRCMPDPFALELPVILSRIKCTVFQIPHRLFCRTLEELRQPGNERMLLSAVGKPTDRWHVRWIRRRVFPSLRWLANIGATPNQITWLGFMIGVSGCMILAQGSYWSGIIGAFLLYISWVFDCMDGTLARLTLAESTEGERLDRLLGHMTNLSIFGALVWAAYGRESPWKAVTYGVFIILSILLAHFVITACGARGYSGSRKNADGKLHKFLDKLNHRDYAVWLFLFALLKGFKVFVWCAMIGIHAYWILYLWQGLRHKRHPS